MKGFVANTDFGWYSSLSEQPALDEVNFWQPSPRGFSAVPPGAPFFFRLKAPHNAIAGFGYFASHSVLPVWLAWEAFGVKNGARDLPEMLTRVGKYRRRFSAAGADRPDDYDVGCIMIASPVFFPRDLWVREPGDWHQNIVVGRGEDLTQGEGRRILSECLQRVAQIGAPLLAHTTLVSEDGPRYGAPVEVTPRLGQGIFRVAVLDAYSRACAVTGEHSLPVLDAAHIKPYVQGGEHDIRNGLVLRSDIHRLFDLGYVTVSPDYQFVVSESLAEEYHNGRDYYSRQGTRLHVPSAQRLQPDRELLAWHGESVFRA